MNIQLTHKAILGLSGANTADLLQSTITQDITKLTPNNALYSAHLTPQGKFMYDFMIISLNNQTALLCNKDELMPLAQALHKYSVGKDVDFHDLSEDYTITANITPEAQSAGTITSRTEDAITFVDPRHASMGTITLQQGAEQPNGNGTLNNYNAHRINLCIPDGAIDAIKERTLINEMYFEELNGVAFDKGCYVGQELTARTKFRTEPKKRLYKLTSSTNITLAKGEKLVSDKGDDLGTIGSHHQGEALAILRTRFIADEQTFTANGITFTAHKPNWL